MAWRPSTHAHRQRGVGGRRCSLNESWAPVVIMQGGAERNNGASIARTTPLPDAVCQHQAQLAQAEGRGQQASRRQPRG
jgi:hypothetical protein